MTTTIPQDERPHYVRIGDILGARIKAGDYSVGALLPTEGEFCEEFSISRHTVREALRRLTESGLIERRQGSGSRVLASEPYQNYVHSMRSLNQLFQYASDTRFIITSITEELPDSDHFPDMSADVDCPWTIVRGLRMERDEDIAICDSIVLIHGDYAEIASDLGHPPIAIYKRIENRFGVTVAEVVQDIDVVPIPPDAARVLAEKPGGLAVRVRRRYLNAAGLPMLASVNFHPVGRFSYTMHLRRDGRRGDWG